MRKTPVVLGVLVMVFGGVQVLMSGVGLLGQPLSKQMIESMGKTFSRLPRQPGQPDVSDAFARLGKLSEELKLYTYLTGFAMLVLSIALIVVGYLLYKRRAQARPFTVAWAIAALAYLPVQVWVHVKVILPRSMEITKHMLARDPNASGIMDTVSAWQPIGTVIYYAVVYAPFPLLLLWLIGRGSAKNDLLPAM